MQIKELDIDRLANWGLRRKTNEMITILNNLYLTRAPVHECDREYYARRLLDNIFFRQLCENEYRELHFYSEHLDYLFEKVVSNPCKESCGIARNLIEAYVNRINNYQKTKLKDLIIQNTINPYTIYRLSKFAPEFQEECEDAIIRLTRENLARPEDSLHSYIEITKQSENQDKMLDALIEAVNEGAQSPVSLSAYASNFPSANADKITECIAEKANIHQIYSWLSNFTGKQKQDIAKKIYLKANANWTDEERQNFASIYNITPPSEEESPLDDILSVLK